MLTLRTARTGQYGQKRVQIRCTDVRTSDIAQALWNWSEVGRTLLDQTREFRYGSAIRQNLDVMRARGHIRS